MQTILIIVATVLISAAIFIPIGILLRRKIAESKISGAENEAQRLLELAAKEAENIKKEQVFKAKEEIMQERNELEKEIRERRRRSTISRKKINTEGRKLR